MRSGRRSLSPFWRARLACWLEAEAMSDLCPDAATCQTCSCAGEDDVCFPGERLRAERDLVIAERDLYRETLERVAYLDLPYRDTANLARYLAREALNGAAGKR